MDVKKYIQNSIDTKTKILNDESILKSVNDIKNAIVSAYKNNKKVLIAGNGGSASDSAHVSAELVSKFFKERKPLSAISLSTNNSIITAIGNDFGFEFVFSKQIEALAGAGDVFIAISTSGNSKNIINALIKAKEMNVITVGLTGENPSPMGELCDFLIKDPSLETPTIQESHIMIEHIICGLIEEELF